MELLAYDFLGKPLWMWAAFIAIVLVLLVLDLGVLHRKSREISIRESMMMTAFYIAIGLAFAAGSGSNRAKRRRSNISRAS